MTANVHNHKVGKNKVIQKGELIGQGLSSKVYSGIFDDKEVAIKRVDQDDDKSEELEYLRQFQHENIVRYLYKDIDYEHEYLYIVMEKCELNLQQFIQKDGENWNKVSISSVEILRQTANGLSYLHGKNIIHRDLKPSNTLLLLRDGKWIVRIADFGISRKIPQDRTKVTQTSTRGTVGNVAPELLRDGKISKKSDIFSLGIIYYFTLSGGEHPFGSDMLKIEAQIRDRETPTMEHIDEKSNPGAKALILMMIADESEKRLDISQVQAHHLFWDDEKALNFIQEVSDYSLTNFGTMSPVLEKNSKDVIGSSWRKKVYEQSLIVEKTLEEMRTKKQKDDICSLLRNIRNLKHHFHEKSDEFKSQMGGSADGMLRFFTSEFPNLIPHTYDVIRPYQKNDSFKNFYHIRQSEIVAPRSNQSPASNTTFNQEPMKPVKEIDVNPKPDDALHDDQREATEQASNLYNSGPEKLVDVKEVDVNPEPDNAFHDHQGGETVQDVKEVDVNPKPDNTFHDDQGEETVKAYNVTPSGLKKPVNVKEVDVNPKPDDQGEETVQISSVTPSGPKKPVSVKEVDVNPKPDDQGEETVQASNIIPSESEKLTIEHVAGDEVNTYPTLRKYQWELAEQALEGKNSLIVAPTGSGKTVVLLEVIRQHIEKSENDDGHVVFMVPKTALAQQQFKFLKKYLPEVCTIDYIIGENVDSAPAGQKILDKKVTVLTPQILINELKRDEEESYLGFDDISMLVFDECHHATKKHPYKEIMDMFLDAQNKQSTKFSTQIVGVTASPGVGKAKDRQKVRENLLTLLANLNIMSIPVVVEKNVEELKKHQNDTKEWFIEVETETQFRKEVEMVMTDLEQSVKTIIAKSSEQHFDKIPSDKSKQSYEKWTDDLIQLGRIHTSDQEVGRLLITYAKHLKMYYRLLQMKDLVPNAMKHTNKLVVFQEVGFANIELNKKNKALQKKAVGIKVPMLDKLFDVIRKEFEKHEDARCIIFVKTRLTAMSLQECMADNSDLVKLHPLYMTGKHASDASEATTKVGQENVLERFKVGDSKILIATSVAEEGLNIIECNLVIMYSHVTGEVGWIQRAGRVRAAGGTAILITSVSSDHVRQEEDNRVCAEASKIAIEDLKKPSSADLKNEILKMQEHQIKKRKLKASLEAKAAAEKDSNSKWEILCGDCGNFITTGDKLRHIENTHTVIKDEGFFSRVIKEEVEQQKSSKIRGTANFHCNNPKCGIKIALEMVYGRTLYPTLSIKKIKLRKDNGKMMVPKTKKNLPFIINKGIDESHEMIEKETETFEESESLDWYEALEIFELESYE